MKEWKALNKNLDEIEFTEYFKKTRNKSEIYCDNIMCFDTEVSSGFIHNGETVEPYKGESQDYYRDCTKVSIVYVWQFSINENIFISQFMLGLYHKKVKKVRMVVVKIKMVKEPNH